MAARGILSNPAMYAGYDCTPLQCVADWVGSLNDKRLIFAKNLHFIFLFLFLFFIKFILFEEPG